MFLNVAITIIWIISAQSLSEHWDYLALKWVIVVGMPGLILYCIEYPKCYREWWHPVHAKGEEYNTAARLEISVLKCPLYLN